MLGKPKVSVVIPAYNEEKYLAECLESLRNQTYPRRKVEIVVCDNNSTDNTVKIAKKFDARVVYEKENQGPVFGRVTGCKAATGKIIFNTDADTILPKNWVSDGVRVLSKPGVVGATGPTDFFESGPVAALVRFTTNAGCLATGTAMGYNIIVKKDAYEKVGGWDPDFVVGEDADLVLKLRKIGRFVFSPKLKAITSSRRYTKKPLYFFFRELPKAMVNVVGTVIFRHAKYNYERVDYR